jgi:hypothetical protein
MKGVDKMYEEKIEQQLRDYFQAETTSIEPSLDWWDSTISNVIGQNKASRRYGFLPRTRLAWVFLPLLLLLLVGGTIYAASSVIDEFFQKSGSVGKNGLSQEMDISQTINGVTVRVQRAYADNNVVLLGYTVSGPTDYLTVHDKLITTDGQSLPGQGAMGFKPGSTEVFDNWAPTERLAVVDTFDTSSLSGVSAELNLNLTVPVQDWTNPIPGIAGAPVVGVFTFNFSVPVHTGKTIEVNQTIEAAGIPITLQKVEISPYQTEVIFKSLPKDIKDSGANPEVTIKTSGVSVSYSSGGYKGDSFVDYFLGDFTGQHGEWTVTINELVSPGFDMTQATELPGNPGVYYCTDCPPSPRVSGPWVFHFKVP